MSEVWSGIVERVTYYNEENGWSVLKIRPFERPSEIESVTVYQKRIFPGATLKLVGKWEVHPKYGKQFKSYETIEERPASLMALEKYLGSGLIPGIGPKTSKKIVKKFGNETLSIFEKDVNKLLLVEGIAKVKLKKIISAWTEHREIRKVILFLQEHNISTLFAVKVYKFYGERAIQIVKDDPYRLAKDIYGIGFRTSDEVALKLGMPEHDARRIKASIRYVILQGKDEGHCFLYKDQIEKNVKKLLNLDINLEKELNQLEEDNEIIVKKNIGKNCYYLKNLFFDEYEVARITHKLSKTKFKIDKKRVNDWLKKYNSTQPFPLSEEQISAIENIVSKGLSILTGGPGCGKTTTTKTLVSLLLAMKKRVLLAAPTGRAAQRMSEVIGLESKTIHRLLVWNPSAGSFKKNKENPLDCDFLLLDETSMIDIKLARSLFEAVSKRTQVLLIGDPDQLPSVGAGNFLLDLINCEVIPVFKLTKIFRQASESKIISSAHQINKGEVPTIKNAFQFPDLWKNKEDMIFLHSEEATLEEIKLIQRLKNYLERKCDKDAIVEKELLKKQKSYEKVVFDKIYKTENVTYKDFDDSFTIPKKFRHIDLEGLLNSKNELEELKEVIKKIHPFSSLHYGLNPKNLIKYLYSKVLPTFHKNDEVQILCPMIKGGIGASNLNSLVQETINPKGNHQEIKIGQKIFRVGDRVIQKKNNYDLDIFNGDIGQIEVINFSEMTIVVSFQNGAKKVVYAQSNFFEIDLAYAITIHKSQGSEFDVVIIPIFTQHFKMLFRNLIYTGITRAKKRVILIGTDLAFTIGVKKIDQKIRQTLLMERIKDFDSKKE